MSRLRRLVLLFPFALVVSAFAQDEIDLEVSLINFHFNGTASNTPFGMIAGVGVEWSFARNWSAFVEYDHYFFSSDTVTFNFPGPTNFLVNVSQNIDAVKGGINLRLNFGP